MSFYVGNWQIVLQKSQKALGLIFRQETKKAKIVDQRDLNALPESPVSLAHWGAVPLCVPKTLSGFIER